MIEAPTDGLERFMKCRGPLTSVGRRCCAALAAQQRGPTVTAATVFVKPVYADAGQVPSVPRAQDHETGDIVQPE